MYINERSRDYILGKSRKIADRRLNNYYHALGPIMHFEETEKNDVKV